MKTRQSNFELLRIVCMFFIVGIHIVTQTSMNGITIKQGIPYFYTVFISTAGRLVCNTFVMIGAWFLTDSKFKAERIVNLWLEILFYATSITVISFAFGFSKVSITLLIQALFPIMGRPVWFGAEYICLLLLSPWLNKMLEKERVQSTKKIMFLIGFLIIVCATLFPIEHTTPVFSELTWFCFLYIFIGLYKHGELTQFSFLEKYRWMICFATYAFLCGLYILKELTGSVVIASIASYYRSHYETAFGFICSVTLFLIFKNIQIGNIGLINRISNSMFAVYVIHQTPAFYPYMWNGLFRVDYMVESNRIILYSLYVIICIFVFSICIDNVRLYICNKILYKSLLYKKCCDRIKRMVQNI